MMTKYNPTPLRKSEQKLLSWLLISLLFTLAVVPIVEHFRDTRVLVHVGLSGVLLAAAALLRSKRRKMTITIVVAVVAVLLSWSTLWVESGGLFLTSAIIDALLFFLIAIFILVTVLTRHLATIESIFGAIAAYLLFGLAFALVYWGIAFVDIDAMRFPEEVSDYVPKNDEASVLHEFSYFVYYSFVTMSTLGFGDITPKTSISQTLTWMQAVIGQFYIAVLVAWLVSEISRGRRRDG